MGVSTAELFEAETFFEVDKEWESLKTLKLVFERCVPIRSKACAVSWCQRDWLHAAACHQSFATIPPSIMLSLSPVRDHPTVNHDVAVACAPLCPCCSAGLDETQQRKFLSALRERVFRTGYIVRQGAPGDDG